MRPKLTESDVAAFVAKLTAMGLPADLARPALHHARSHPGDVSAAVAAGQEAEGEYHGDDVVERCVRAAVAFDATQSKPTSDDPVGASIREGIRRAFASDPAPTKPTTAADTKAEEDPDPAKLFRDAARVAGVETHDGEADAKHAPALHADAGGGEDDPAELFKDAAKAVGVATVT